MLFVTHDIAEAVYLGDRVAVMDRGRIALAASVDLARPRVADCRYDPHFTAHCQHIRAAMVRPIAEAA